MTSKQQHFAEEVFSIIESLIDARHSARLAELLALCSNNKGRAAYYIVSFLSKPGRIPGVFATLLDLSQEDALARAFVAYYCEQLRQVITPKQETWLLNLPLA